MHTCNYTIVTSTKIVMLKYKDTGIQHTVSDITPQLSFGNA